MRTIGSLNEIVNNKVHMVKSMDLVKGGRGAIERMVEAYGFSTRQALCEQLGVSKSTLATRYMRDSFPSDWVIQCTLETGASLRWLTSGEGKMFEDFRNDLVTIPRKKLAEGKLLDSNHYYFDKSFLPELSSEAICIIDNGVAYLADRTFHEVRDGKWLVDIEGKVYIRDIIRIPNGNIKVEGGKYSFDCKLDEIVFLARIKSLTFTLD